MNARASWSSLQPGRRAGIPKAQRRLARAYETRRCRAACSDQAGGGGVGGHRSGFQGSESSLSGCPARSEKKISRHLTFMTPEAGGYNSRPEAGPGRARLRLPGAGGGDGWAGAGGLGALGEVHDDGDGQRSAHRDHVVPDRRQKRRRRFGGRAPAADAGWAPFLMLRADAAGHGSSLLGARARADR
jgi:hypothetical protein